MDFDTLRAKYPHLGYAAYAYVPGGPVTLECITPEGQTFKFTGPTMLLAIDAGFPEDDVEPSPDLTDASPAGSVFD